MGIESPVHLLFIAIVALLVLGPKRLPDLARSLGNGIREFRQSLDMGAQDQSPQVPPPPAASTTTTTPPPPAPDVPTASPSQGAAAEPPPSASAQAPAAEGQAPPPTPPS
jgi:TatA/E family protein of Tat protein translocase